jgi:hypothetical protein
MSRYRGFNFNRTLRKRALRRTVNVRSTYDSHSADDEWTDDNEENVQIDDTELHSDDVVSVEEVTRDEVESDEHTHDTSELYTSCDVDDQSSVVSDEISMSGNESNESSDDVNVDAGNNESSDINEMRLSVFIQVFIH